MSKPAVFNDWPASVEVAWEYRAVVDRIVDGDTLYVFIDQGLNNYAYESIRLQGVNAPELFSGDNREAGAEARDQLAMICPPGTRLRLYTEKDHMTFGRYVGRCLMENGSYVNDLMNAWLARPITE